MSAETLETGTERASARMRTARDVPGFIIVWAAEPGLVGAWLPLPDLDVPMTLGREEGDLKPVRQRPGFDEKAPPLADPFLSREQLRITAKNDGIHVENLGKRDLLDGEGRAVTSLVAKKGEVVEVGGRLLLLASERPATFPTFQNLPKGHHPFGEPDAHGLVGESDAVWRLRDAASFVASRAAHVLLLGESGTGKEVVAQAIHSSSKNQKRLVSRNAATLPAGLIDAELFGHVANYPNVGMPERPGLIGDANGGSLFLDEIGELPHELSTKLLRVLDDGGEYQRLGDARTRNSKFRLIAATNRAVTSLKADVAARFRLRIAVPPLNDRREDIPLLARHLLRRAAHDDPAIGERFFEGWDGKTGEPRLSIELVRTLVTHSYVTHIRELDVMLWASLGQSTGNVAEDIEAPDASDEEGSQASTVDVRTLTEQDVRAAIEAAGGVHDKAWRAMGLSNRHVLKRLVKKFGI